MFKNLLFSLVLLLTSTLAIGQYEINPQEIIFEADEVQNIELHVYATNNTETNDPVYWKLDLAEDFPDNWKIQICAGINCFNWGDLDCPPTAPHTIEVGTTADYKFTIQDTTFGVFLTGTSSAILNLYSDYEFTNLVASSSDPSTSTVDVSSIDISIFPNPTTQSFQLKNDASVSIVNIYNNAGERLKARQHSAGMIHDVSDLIPGLYLLRIENDRGDLIKTMRLNKQ